MTNDCQIKINLNSVWKQIQTLNNIYLHVRWMRGRPLSRIWKLIRWEELQKVRHGFQVGLGDLQHSCALNEYEK